MFESRAWLRTIGSAMSAVGGILVLIPEPTCQTIGHVLIEIGIPLGGLGVVRAATEGTLFSLEKKKEDPDNGESL